MSLLSILNIHIDKQIIAPSCNTKLWSSFIILNYNLSHIFSKLICLYIEYKMYIAGSPFYKVDGWFDRSARKSKVKLHLRPVTAVSSYHLTTTKHSPSPTLILLYLETFLGHDSDGVPLRKCDLRL